jgi:hypothetical protein
MMRMPALSGIADGDGEISPFCGQDAAPIGSDGLTVRIADAQIDPAWDALVEAALGGDLVQTTLWAATRQRIGARVRHLRLCASDGTPVAGCLIQYRRVLPILSVGVVPRGPLVFVDRPGLAGRMVREMIRAARRAGIFLLFVQPPEGAGDRLLAAMRHAGFRLGGPPLAPDATIRIELRRSEEEVLRGAHPRRRTHIRNAVRSSLECCSSDDIETFHRLHRASSERLGFPPIGIANLKAQWEILAPSGTCHLVEVRHDGTPIGGEWLTRFGGTVTNKLRGQDLGKVPPSPATKAAGTASLWASICWARSAGARYFDFSGFDRPAAEAVLAGKPLPADIRPSSQIKWSFGGEVVLLPQSHFVLTNRLAQYSLGGLASPLLTSNMVRRLAQRVRARHGGRGADARNSP